MRRRRPPRPGAHRHDLRATAQRRHDPTEGREAPPLVFNAANVALVYDAAEGRVEGGAEMVEGAAALLVCASVLALCPADARRWYVAALPSEVRAALRWIVAGEGDTSAAQLDTTGRPPAPTCDPAHADRPVYARGACHACHRKLGVAGEPIGEDGRDVANPRLGLARFAAGLDAIVSRGGRSLRQMRARIGQMPPARALALLLLVRPETREHFAAGVPGVWVEGADGRVMELRRRPSAESDDS